MPSNATKRTEYAAGHRDFMATLGLDDDFMVTTRSPKVPVARVLKEANRRYRHTHHERVSPVNVQSDDGVHHAHELFQKRPGMLLDLLRFRLTSGGSVMATFHEGMIRYAAKNLEHESAKIEYDAGLKKRTTPTVPATEPGPMKFGDAGDSRPTPPGKTKCATKDRASTQVKRSPTARAAGARCGNRGRPAR